MAAVKTITEQVYDNIYELILNRTFAPGMKLTLKTLQEELGVSSSPIREALTRLQQDGIVDYQPNSGMKLRTYTDKEVQDLFTVLSDLDMISLKYALDSDNREILIQKLKHNTQASKAMISDVDVAEWLSFSDKFHKIIADAADNPFLQDCLRKIYRHITIFSVQYETDSSNRDLIQAAHEHIVELLEEGNYDEAILEYKNHVLLSADLAKSCLAK